ncbi:MAG: hypothetical protein H0U86_08825 [Chloroflexi bacterium]|nr:hypothetical protein [Chloroflexota bacterium]
MGRWRGRRLAGLALAAFLAVAGVGAIAMASDRGPGWIVVRDSGGVELARASLPPSAEFSMRYRNSVYRSFAEERFRVTDDHLEIVELRAQELAVLEEYYTAVGAVENPASSLRWRITVDRPPVALPLRVQATALGERTLVTADAEIALWRLVAGRDDTVVVLTIEGRGEQ